MSDKRICKYCGMELSEDVPHGLRECRLHAVARIAELKGVIEILEDQQREVKNILIDKNLHIDSLYEEGYKLQQRIAELEAENTALKQLPQPIEFWSDEKKELYRRNESRTIKSGREEERER